MNDEQQNDKQDIKLIIDGAKRPTKRHLGEYYSRLMRVTPALCPASTCFVYWR